MTSLHPSLSLHKEFVPAYRWHQSYQRILATLGNQVETLTLWIQDASGYGSSVELKVAPRGNPEQERLTQRWVERVVKMLLWQRGGCDIWIDRRPDLVAHLRFVYKTGGARGFDHEFFSSRVYHSPLNFHYGTPSPLPKARACGAVITEKPAGCRIGYDLGGSDRKCAAIIDGEVVFSEEIPWSPYHETDPQYHVNGVRDSLKRAAAHLPRVDAIGGSSAGVIIDHVPEVGSLFRGLSASAMAEVIRPFFRGLSAEWDRIPVTLLNDGEVTALAGASWLKKTGVLGIAMGTSLASGYVDPLGRVGHYLNELAFCPIDFHENAPADEWSGDLGCGVQYFSQQAVFRLASEAGIQTSSDLTPAQQLQSIQSAAHFGDERALAVFRRIGQYLGETLPFWRLFYEFDQLLLLGRVVSGIAGECIVCEAERIMKERGMDSDCRVEIHVPDETFKRHGQAIVAASIPQLNQI